MAKFDLPTVDLKNIELIDVATKPLYAGVGATDLAVEVVRDVAGTVQQKVTDQVRTVRKSVRDFEFPEPKTLPNKAQDLVVARRAKVEARVAELQTQVSQVANRRYDVATVTGAYDDLAKRGEVVITRIRKGDAPVVKAADTVVDKAETAKPAAKKAPVKKTAAKKAPAKKTAAKKPAAKKAPAKKPAAKKAPAKKTAEQTPSAN